MPLFWLTRKIILNKKIHILKSKRTTFELIVSITGRKYSCLLTPQFETVII